MNVETILSIKGRHVYTIGRSKPLGEAVGLLGGKNIGAVIVTDEQGRCCGILSERDIVRHMSRSDEPSGLLARPVESFMTAEVHTCGPAAELGEVLSMMTVRRVRHLPVIDGGRLVGVVSIGDVVKLKIDMAEREAQVLKDYIAS